jgi:hypothetical protein
VSYRPGTATGRSIPFPVGGWNTRDPIDTMDPMFAQTMDNIFPGEREGEIRGGSVDYVTAGLGTGEVSTLTEHVSASGTRTFIACANGNIVNVTNPAATSNLGTGFANNRWQTIDFRNRKLFFNGVSTPQQYDGATLSNAVYTGVAGSTLIQGTAYRNRLYLIPINSASFWYGNANAITGALTEFDCGPLLTRGGFIQFVTTWTRAASGTSSSELFVVVSSEGEILVFGGGSPEAEGFSLVGHTFAPKPLGRRAFINYLTDVEISTQTEVVSLTRLMSGEAALGTGALTDKIAPTFSAAAKMYGSNFGWQPVLYSAGRRILYNIPISSGSQSHQYVRNILTGAWCRFKDMNAASWSVFNDNLYFGTWDGKIVQADIGANDRNANINFQVFLSYNYFGDRERVKHFQNVRPILTSDGPLTVGLSMSVDRVENNSTDTVSIVALAGTSWDVADWDSFFWSDDSYPASDWYAVNGIGRSGAIKMLGSVKDVRFSVSAFHVTHDQGGML